MEGPEWASTLDTLGVALLANGRLAEAAEALETSCGLDPLIPHRWHLAEARDRAGDHAGAAGLLAGLANDEPRDLEERRILEKVAAAGARPEKLW